MKEIGGFLWPDNVKADGKDHSKRSLQTGSLDLLLKHWKGRRALCVQAGGSYGVWPIKLSKNFDMTITFEPDEESFKCLLRNLEKHKVPLTKVVVFCAGLGAKEYMGFVRRNSFTGHYILDKQTQPDLQPVWVRTIDSLFEVSAPKTVDAIILDIEGMELPALLGAEKTIKGYRPIILWENRPEVMQRYNRYPEEIKDFLSVQGYVKVADKAHDEIWVPGEEVGKSWLK